jgi:hypothetical protein
MTKKLLNTRRRLIKSILQGRILKGCTEKEKVEYIMNLFLNVQQKIYITVKGGVATVTKCPANIDVIINDLD